MRDGRREDDDLDYSHTDHLHSFRSLGSKHRFWGISKGVVMLSQCIDSTGTAQEKRHENIAD
jgi:hypothetical protein